MKTVEISNYFLKMVLESVQVFNRDVFYAYLVTSNASGDSEFGNCVEMELYYYFRYM